MRFYRNDDELEFWTIDLYAVEMERRIFRATI